MVRFVALDTAPVRALQSGGIDANGHPCEHAVSSGSGTPCRHCLRQIAAGEQFLILSYRPFPAPQPYAEQGPVFLHARQCTRHTCDGRLPPMLDSPRYMLRGYDVAHRIVYGTGTIAATAEIPERAQAILADARVDYVHVRSATNNCYQCRIDRA